MAEDPEAAFLLAMKAQQDAEVAELNESEDYTSIGQEENTLITTPEPPSIDDLEITSGLDSSDNAPLANTSAVRDPSLLSSSSSSSSPAPTNDEPATVSHFTAINPEDTPILTPDVEAMGSPSNQYGESAGPFMFDDDDDDEKTSGTNMLSTSAPVDMDTSDQSDQNANFSLDVTSDPSNAIPDYVTSSKETSQDVLTVPYKIGEQSVSSNNTTTITTSPANPVVPSSSSMTSVNKRKRLPQDIVGQLEDRILEDPRGDIDAWLSLINEHQKKGKLDEARATYERYFKVFPTAADQWVSYCQLELAANEFKRVEVLFNRCLLSVFNVELWSLYLDYIRRMNNLATDTGGKLRGVVCQAYEFVLGNIGIDKDSGKIWQDYISFIKSGAGTIGGSNWQDQQKMDQLRKAYQRAICIPVNGVETMWKEYDGFEMGLNKMTGRKFLQEKSPLHMTARSSLSELKNLTSGLVRTSTPRLPPLPGFDGFEEYNEQIEIWKKWIAWEKSDPLVLASEDVAALQTRIKYIYKQALMALRFWPEIWYDAFEYCTSIGKTKEAVDFLKQGMAANPESCLLHFRYAEYLEASVPAPPVEDREAVKRKSTPIRQVYDSILDVYYKMITKIQAREKDTIANIEEANTIKRLDDDDDDDADFEPAPPDTKDTQINLVKEATKVETLIISKTISAIWINLMRAIRRLEGHGKVGDLIGGSRQIFADARKRGKITSDVYVASALIEYHCYKDPSASRIFDKGMKVFPDDVEFALEYLKHLISINDLTNARAVFETFVSKITVEKAESAKRIYHFFYEYESQYGELSQEIKLEKRMQELYPSDPQLRLFTKRYSYKAVDPSTFVPAVSLSQTRPRQMGTLNIPFERSPKRAAESDNEYTRHNEGPNKKIHRAESPQIKGAAGRRLDQQKRAAAATRNESRDYRNNNQNNNNNFRDRDTYQQPQQSQPLKQSYSQPFYPTPQPPAIPDAVIFLLSILPPAYSYTATRFKPEEIVKLLMNVNLPSIMPGAGSNAFGFQR